MVARSTYYTYYYLPAYYNYTPAYYAYTAAVYSEYYQYIPAYYKYTKEYYRYYRSYYYQYYYYVTYYYNYSYFIRGGYLFTLDTNTRVDVYYKDISDLNGGFPTSYLSYYDCPGGDMGYAFQMVYIQSYGISYNYYSELMNEMDRGSFAVGVSTDGYFYTNSWGMVYHWGKPHGYLFDVYLGYWNSPSSSASPIGYHSYSYYPIFPQIYFYLGSYQVTIYYVWQYDWQWYRWYSYESYDSLHGRILYSYRTNQPAYTSSSVQVQVDHYYYRPKYYKYTAAKYYYNTVLQTAAYYAYTPAYYQYNAEISTNPINYQYQTV